MILFEEVKELLKTAISETDNINAALERVVQSIYSKGYADGSSSVQPEPCEDAISRSDAILAIQRHGVGCYDAEYFSPEQSERYVINLLKALPAAGSK